MLHPSTILAVLLVATFVLLLLATLSIPIVKTIPLGRTDTIQFGIWGSCSSGECTSIGLGYDVDRNGIGSHYSLPKAIRSNLTYVLIVHPIAAAFTLISLILALVAHRYEASRSPRYLLGLFLAVIVTLVVTALAIVADILLFVPHLGWGSWIVITAGILLVISAIFAWFIRRAVVVRRAHQKKVDENPHMNGALLPTMHSKLDLDQSPLPQTGTAVGFGSRLPAMPLHEPVSGSPNMDKTVSSDSTSTRTSESPPQRYVPPGVSNHNVPERYFIPTPSPMTRGQPQQSSSPLIQPPPNPNVGPPPARTDQFPAHPKPVAYNPFTGPNYYGKPGLPPPQETLRMPIPGATRQYPQATPPFPNQTLSPYQTRPTLPAVDQTSNSYQTHQTPRLPNTNQPTLLATGSGSTLRPYPTQQDPTLLNPRPMPMGNPDNDADASSIYMPEETSLLQNLGEPSRPSAVTSDTPSAKTPVIDNQKYTPYHGPNDIPKSDTEPGYDHSDYYNSNPRASYYSPYHESRQPGTGRLLSPIAASPPAAPIAIHPSEPGFDLVPGSGMANMIPQGINATLRPPPRSSGGTPDYSFPPSQRVPPGYRGSHRAPPNHWINSGTDGYGISIPVNPRALPTSVSSSSLASGGRIARSPTASESSYLTSISQRGINPNWRNPNPNPGYGPAYDGPRYPAPSSSHGGPRLNEDSILANNPEFSLPGSRANRARAGPLTAGSSGGHGRTRTSKGGTEPPLLSMQPSPYPPMGPMSVSRDNTSRPPAPPPTEQRDGRYPAPPPS